MPPKKVVPDTPGEESDEMPVPTQSEYHMFYTLVKNMKTKPEIDWDVVATDNKFKNAETAKVRFGQIKRKLGLENVFTGASGGAAPPKPAARARAKKGSAANTPVSNVKTEGVLGGGVKKSRGTGKRGVRPKIEDFVSDASDPATPTKSKKGSKKSAFKTEVKDEEDLTLASQDGEEAMEMDDEEPLGQITPPETRAPPHNLATAPASDDVNHDSDLEVTGSAVVNGRGHPHSAQEVNVQVHPAYTGSFFSPAPVPTSTTGNGYEGFIPRSTGGNGYEGFDPQRTAGGGSGTSGLELGTTTGNYAPPTFGGIREQNISDDDLEVSQLPLQRDVLAPALPIRNNDTGRDGGVRGSIDDINFASMMASNLPGGGSSNSYGSQSSHIAPGHDFGPDGIGYGVLEGPPDIFQPTPTRPGLFGGNVEVLNNAESYFAPPRKQGRARKSAGDGDADDDARTTI